MPRRTTPVPVADTQLAELEQLLGIRFQQGTFAAKRAQVAALSEPYQAIEVLRGRVLDLFHAGLSAFVAARGDAPHALYALPAIDPLEVAQLCEVGSHGGCSSVEVLQVLKQIQERSPFEVFFADAAGFKARFLAPPSEAEARRIEELVLDVCIDAINLIDSDEPDYAQAIVLEKQSLELWWD